MLGLAWLLFGIVMSDIVSASSYNWQVNRIAISLVSAFDIAGLLSSCFCLPPISLSCAASMMGALAGDSEWLAAFPLRLNTLIILRKPFYLFTF